MATRNNNARNKTTRKNNKNNGNGNGNTMEGGKRKLSAPLKKWNQHVMAVYKTMKAKNKNTKLRDAMKAAKKTYRKH